MPSPSVSVGVDLLLEVVGGATSSLTVACATLEAVCRSILVELGQDLPAKKDVSALVHAFQEPFGLSPGRTDLPDLIAGDIRKAPGVTGYVSADYFSAP